MYHLFIRPMSDLHCEFKEFDYHFEGEHILALAGDINTGTTGLSWANNLEVKAHDLNDVHICYVAGNHEYYGTNMAQNDKALKKMSSRHVHVLNNSDVQINGVCFLGTT